MATVALRPTPLWPAGHLPLKGGDHSRRRHAQSAATLADRMKRIISPLEGEMPGRAEGGVTERDLSDAALKALRVNESGHP